MAMDRLLPPLVSHREAGRQPGAAGTHATLTPGAIALAPGAARFAAGAEAAGPARLAALRPGRAARPRGAEGAGARAGPVHESVDRRDERAGLPRLSAVP